MNTDKLIADTFNNRTSTLDISPEKFDEMFEYIGREAELRQIPYLTKIKNALKQFIATFHIKGLIQVALAVLIVMSVPAILKNGPWRGSTKSATDSSGNSSAFDKSKGSSSYEDSTQKSEESKENIEGATGSTPKYTEGEGILLTLTPKTSSQTDRLSMTVQDIHLIISSLKSCGAKAISINDIAIVDTTSIKNNQDSNTILVDGKKISTEYTIEFKALGSKNQLYKALDVPGALSFSSMDHYTIQIHMSDTIKIQQPRI